MELRGSSAIVTGGASGLGEATVRRLHADGLRVVILDVNDERGKQLATELGVEYARADITSETEVIAAVDAAVALAPLRAVVSCAGGGGLGGRTIGRDGSYASAHSLESYTNYVMLNLVGTFNVVRLAATAMSRNEPDADGGRGAIVMTASVAAFEGQVGQAGYGSSKAGIVGLTLPVARDLSPAGIRVNTIAPGLFDTPPMRAWGTEMRDSLAKTIPFPKRLGDPAEFAALAQHLLTNSYVNGQTFRLDGGVRMQPK
ncbi:MAG TPA: SDR family NAD(P)-dependent oxidoreductase [Pseudonocardiaceae bacterium]|nr:SDR family NAD(P)-dependent oxidoreductase [Pseudonocardiaceae bacterium]